MAWGGAWASVGSVPGLGPPFPHALPLVTFALLAQPPTLWGGVRLPPGQGWASKSCVF